MSSVSSPPGPAEPETIAIGCDHAGHGLKREILKLLHELKVPHVDLGCATMVAIKMGVESYRQSKTLLWDAKREKVIPG